MRRYEDVRERAVLVFLRGGRHAASFWTWLGVWQWAAAVIPGIALGLASAFFLVTSGRGELHAGAWATSLTYGSAEADIYTRARVALFGLLALSREQTIYFTAARDSAGRPLSGDCTYLVKGRDLDARWWSLTAYGPDSHLIANEPGIYSYSKTTVAREADGGFVLRVSAAPQPGNWLPVKPGERFDMTMRFYNPAPSLAADLTGAPLPTIAREDCR